MKGTNKMPQTLGKTWDCRGKKYPVYTTEGKPFDQYDVFIDEYGRELRIGDYFKTQSFRRWLLSLSAVLSNPYAKMQLIEIMYHLILKVCKRNCYIRNPEQDPPVLFGKKAGESEEHEK